MHGNHYGLSAGTYPPAPCLPSAYSSLTMALKRKERMAELEEEEHLRIKKRAQWLEEWLDGKHREPGATAPGYPGMARPTDPGTAGSSTARGSTASSSTAGGSTAGPKDPPPKARDTDEIVG